MKDLKAWTLARFACALALGVVLGACAEDGRPAARGRQVYQAQCVACHGTDPAKAGVLGPAIKGSSRELLEAKILRGTYPPGYTPKRPSVIMQPMPHLVSAIPDLAAFLK